MKRISDFLSNTKGMARFLNDRSIEDQIKAVWGDVAGKLASELIILYFRDKNLYLKSTNPVWQSEVSFISSQIIESLKKLFKKSVIDRVIVVSDDGDNESPASCSRVNTDLSLEELIKFENRHRVQMGMSLCCRCNDVYCFDDLCIFCLSKGG